MVLRPCLAIGIGVVVGTEGSRAIAGTETVVIGSDNMVGDQVRGRYIPADRGHVRGRDIFRTEAGTGLYLSIVAIWRGDINGIKDGAGTYLPTMAMGGGDMVGTNDGAGITYRSWPYRAGTSWGPRMGCSGTCRS